MLSSSNLRSVPDGNQSCFSCYSLETVSCELKTQVVQGHVWSNNLFKFTFRQTQLPSGSDGSSGSYCFEHLWSSFFYRVCAATADFIVCNDSAPKALQLRDDFFGSCATLHAAWETGEAFSWTEGGIAEVTLILHFGFRTLESFLMFEK